MKKVSVIIPIYRVEQYIAATVESVLAQTYKNLEIIIVDDESPDKSQEICQQFTDSRIKIIHQKNRGLAGARNTGIRHAQGDYIAFLDGDDIWLPHKLEKHLEHLEKFLEVGISFSPSAFINENGDSLENCLRPKLKCITPPDLLRDNPIGNGSSAVLRREVLEEIKFSDNLYGDAEYFYFDEHFRQAEDLECWLRIAIKTQWQFEGIPEALTLYRVNSAGLSASLLRQLEYLDKVLEKAYSYAPELILQWQKNVKAYQLRYLARSAVRRKDGSMAVKLIHRALAADWVMIIEQPRRTISTLAGAYLLWLLPQPLYYQIEALFSKISRNSQENSAKLA
jgi:glycosyltransferase involved in cell wall biosynthesis